jgi:hypothetical protein
LTEKSKGGIGYLHIADKNTKKNTKNVALSENQSSQTKDLMDTVDILLFFLDSENQPMSHKREGKNTQTKPIILSQADL